MGEKETNVLVVYSAKFGVYNVIKNIVPRLREQDLNITCLTLPGREFESDAGTMAILDEELEERLSGIPPLYIPFVKFRFWYKAYNYISEHEDQYETIWLHNPRIIHLLPDYVAEKTLATHHNHLHEWKTRYHSFPTSLYYKSIGMSERYGLISKDGVNHTVVNGQVGEQLISMGVSPNNVTVVRNGVDLGLFNPNYDPPELFDQLDVSEPILLSLGRLTEQKRPMKLVKMYQKLQEEIDCTLLLAGTGPMSDEIKKYKKNYSLSGLRILGYVDEDIKPALYAASDYFMIASKYDPGGPLTLFEALASGTPCITSSIGEFGFIDENNLGLSVDINEMRTSKERILDFLKHPPTKETLRNYADHHLGWERAVRQYSKILNEVSKKK